MRRPSLVVAVALLASCVVGSRADNGSQEDIPRAWLAMGHVTYWVCAVMFNLSAANHLHTWQALTVNNPVVGNIMVTLVTVGSLILLAADWFPGYACVRVCVCVCVPSCAVLRRCAHSVWMPWKLCTASLLCSHFVLHMMPAALSVTACVCMRVRVRVRVWMRASGLVRSSFRVPWQCLGCLVCTGVVTGWGGEALASALRSHARVPQPCMEARRGHQPGWHLRTGHWLRVHGTCWEAERPWVLRLRRHPPVLHGAVPLDPFPAPTQGSLRCRCLFACATGCRVPRQTPCAASVTVRRALCAFAVHVGPIPCPHHHLACISSRITQHSHVWPLCHLGAKYVSCILRL